MTSKGHNVQFVTVPEGAEKSKVRTIKKFLTLLKKKVYISTFAPPQIYGYDCTCNCG